MPPTAQQDADILRDVLRQLHDGAKEYKQAAFTIRDFQGLIERVAAMPALYPLARPALKTATALAEKLPIVRLSGTAEDLFQELLVALETALEETGSSSTCPHCGRAA